MGRKIALVGANGQLATDIAKNFPKEKISDLALLSHKDIEITDIASVESAFSKVKPDLVLNTAAYNRVDDAESESELAFAINSIGPKNLAHYCKENDIPLAHVSTDYVFGQDTTRATPYKEDDTPGPINAYGISKLAGELFVQYTTQKHFIIRSSGLFGVAGSSGKGGNFVELMLKIAREKGQVRVVADQIVTPTYTLDLAKQILAIIQTDTYGLYHATAQGSCSWYEFAKEIFRLTNTKVDLVSVSSSEFPTPAKRGMYSVLENKKLKELGIDVMRPWQDGLKDYLKEKGYLSLTS